MELGEEIERIAGSESFTYRYREEEKVFFDKDSEIITKEWGWFEVSYEDLENEYEDIDPQF